MYDDIADRLEAAVSRFEQSLNCSNVLVSCTEAARLLGKTPTTISKMIREKRLTKVTIGESTGIRLSDIWELKAS
jgi:excisionase family DNA binding protein